ncbi:MAG: NAD(P)/FAD-dependent oxidoreductase [Gemmatimonadota bacterium]
MTPTAHTVVIGAGVSGLATARTLQAAGVDVVVLEARDRVGGRLRSVPLGDAGVDLGATWFWANEPRVVALVEEFGLATHAQHLAGDALYQIPGVVQRIAGNPIDGPAWRLSAGTQRLAEALAECLDEGTVRLEHVVSAIRAVDGLLSVEGSFGSIEGRHVVVALPPVLAVHALDFDPPLPESTRAIAGQVPVWMGSMTKVVIRYATPFWRERGLAGAVMSHAGPMREMHDMSGPAGDPAALFGFAPPLHPQAPTVSEDAVRRQLTELFGADAPEPVDVAITDWRMERFTTPPGAVSLQSYETYGHPVFQTPTWEGRLHWSSTETSRDFPGHIEGALSAAARTAEAILSGA